MWTRVLGGLVGAAAGAHFAGWTPMSPGGAVVEASEHGAYKGIFTKKYVASFVFSVRKSTHVQTAEDEEPTTYREYNHVGVGEGFFSRLYMGSEKKPAPTMAELFDLTTRRCGYMHFGTRERTEQSLFAHVYSMQMRVRDFATMLLQASSGASIDASALFGYEAQLGVRGHDVLPTVPVVPVHPKESRRGGVTKVQFIDDGGAVVAEVELAKLPMRMTDLERRTYNCMLAHNTTLHPTVLEHLVETHLKKGTHYVRRFKTVANTQAGRAATEWEVAAVTTMRHGKKRGDAPTTLLPCPHYEPRYYQDSELNKLMIDGFARRHVADEASALRTIEAHATAGRYAQSFLAHVAYTYASGEKVGMELLQSLEEWRQADPTLRAVLDGAYWTEDDGEAVAALREARGKVPAPEGDVIGVFIASREESRGNDTAAIEAYLSVLKSHPHIVGVMRDLGIVYLTAQQPFRAWQMFTLAKYTNPNHPHLADVNELERALRRNFPAFFLAEEDEE